MVSIRLYGRTPLMWHRSRAHEIDKNNADLDVQLCALSTVWTCLASRTTNGCGRTQHPMRSVFMQVNTRLGNRGFLPLSSKQHVQKDCDVQDNLRKGARPCDRELLRQRHMHACMHIEASDKDLNVRPHSGNLQGDTRTHMQVLSFLRCIIRVLSSGLMNALPALETSWSPLSRSQVVWLTSPCPRMQTM